MEIELSQDQLQTIEAWYHAAAEQNISGTGCKLMGLLEKLGFKPHYRDQYKFKYEIVTDAGKE